MYMRCRTYIHRTHIRGRMAERSKALASEKLSLETGGFESHSGRYFTFSEKADAHQLVT